MNLSIAAERETAASGHRRARSKPIIRIPIRIRVRFGVRFGVRFRVRDRVRFRV